MQILTETHVCKAVKKRVVKTFSTFQRIFNMNLFSLFLIHFRYQSILIITQCPSIMNSYLSHVRLQSEPRCFSAEAAVAEAAVAKAAVVSAFISHQPASRAPFKENQENKNIVPECFRSLRPRPHHSMVEPQRNVLCISGCRRSVSTCTSAFPFRRTILY